MKSTLLLLLIYLPVSMFSQEIKSLEFKELQKESLNSGDSLIVYNFWATWCKPCIEELPSFEKANSKYAAQNVKVILVNLDFNSKVDEVTKPFLKTKNIKSIVYHPTDTDPNEWINKIDPTWSGAIPATVMYQNGEKVYFKEGQVSEQELFQEIEIILEQFAKNHESKD